MTSSWSFILQILFSRSKGLGTRLCYTHSLFFCVVTRPTESMEHIVIANILLPSMREVSNFVKELLQLHHYRRKRGLKIHDIFKKGLHKCVTHFTCFWSRTVILKEWVTSFAMRNSIKQYILIILNTKNNVKY